MEALLAWAGAIAIGISLGLFGSGGSILTVPVLVYLFGQDEKLAIASSLAIVGVVAAAGATAHLRSRLIDWRQVLWFGVPGMGGTYLGAYGAQFVSGTLQLTVFATVMFVAAGFMLKPPTTDVSSVKQHGRALIVGEGLLVGALTGFVGVGGGFLIIPALVLLGRLSMPSAIATSLVIIALKSFTGFYKYLDVLDTLGLAIDWSTIALVSLLGVAGLLVGGAIGARLAQPALQRGFAVFLIAMAGYILWRTLSG